MEAWILTMILQVSGGIHSTSISVTTQEYSSKENCDKATTAFLINTSNHSNGIRADKAIAYCLKK